MAHMVQTAILPVLLSVMLVMSTNRSVIMLMELVCKDVKLDIKDLSVMNVSVTYCTL